MTDRDTVEEYVWGVNKRAEIEGDKAFMAVPDSQGRVAANAAGWNAERKVWADAVRALLAERDEARGIAEEHRDEFVYWEGYAHYTLPWERPTEEGR